MKKITTLLIGLILLFTLSAAQAEFFSDVIVTSPNGIWTDSRAYATLNAAITAVGANQRTVVIASPQTVTSLTVPANITLKFERDGAIVNSGQLTLNTRNIIADSHQIFTGLGDLDFTAGTIVKLSWFHNLWNAVTMTSDDTVVLVINKSITATASCALGNNVALKWESPGNIITVAAPVTVSNIGQIEAGDYQLFAGAGTFSFTDGIELNLSWFPRLRSIITWIGTTRANLIITGTNTVDVSDTVPSNINLDFSRRQGILSISTGITLTLNSATIVTDDRQIFILNGTGAVLGLKYATPEMFAVNTTPGTTDMGPAILAAFNAAAELRLRATTYRLNSGQLTPTNDKSIKGMGYLTIVNWYGTGYWLDNHTTNVVNLFTISGLTYNDMAATSLGFLRLGDKTSVFSENNWKRIYANNLAINGYAPAGVITAGTVGFDLTQVNLSDVSNLNIQDFAIGMELTQYDVSRKGNIRIQRFLTYGLYIHNNLVGGTPGVSDESQLMRFDIIEVPATATAAVYFNYVVNMRLGGFFIEPAGPPGIPLAFKISNAANVSLNGVTVGRCVKTFEILDSHSINLINISTQNLADLTAISTVTWSTGARRQDYHYGGVKLLNCSYSINQQFVGLPWVDIVGAGPGNGLSLNGGELSGVSNLYSGQVLDRLGAGSLRETDLVISPFSSNQFLFGMSTGSVDIVADATASRGYALKIPELTGGLVGFRIYYPANILAGDYELIVRARWATAGATLEGFYLYYNGGVVYSTDKTVDTVYKIYSARFNYAPAGATDTFYLLIGTEKDLYIDYMILRPAFNSVFFQTYVPRDTDVWATGHKVVYGAAAPVAGVWAVGDIVFNSNATIGQPIGWMCTTAGTPGTFRAMPNL